MPRPAPQTRWVRHLQVTALDGRLLQNKKQDITPYLQFSLHGRLAQTPFSREPKRPAWDTTHEMPVDPAEPLRLSVWMRDGSRFGEPVGECTVDVGGLPLQGIKHRETVNLQAGGHTAATVNLNLTGLYYSFELDRLKSLKVVVVEGMDIQSSGAVAVGLAVGSGPPRRTRFVAASPKAVWGEYFDWPAPDSLMLQLSLALESEAQSHQGPVNIADGCFDLGKLTVCTRRCVSQWVELTHAGAYAGAIRGEVDTEFHHGGSGLPPSAVSPKKSVKGSQTNTNAAYYSTIPNAAYGNSGSKCHFSHRPPSASSDVKRGRSKSRDRSRSRGRALSLSSRGESIYEMEPSGRSGRSVVP